MKSNYRVLLWVGLILISLKILFSNLDRIAQKILFQPSYDDKENTERTIYYHYKKDHFILTNQDSLHLEKYFVRNPKGVIVYFHGNRSNLKRWGPIASQFTKFGYNVVCWDYRGYGKSSGNPTTENILSDGQLVLNLVIKADTTNHIILFGRSLGSGVACYLSTHSQVDKIILETPYFSLSDVIEHHVPILAPAINLNIPSFEYVKNVNKPFLLLHGDRDKVIPLKSAEKLMNAIQPRYQKIVEFKNGTHNNLFQFKLYWQSIETFLNG